MKALTDETGFNAKPVNPQDHKRIVEVIEEWLPISDYPKDSPVVQRWHKIYNCIVSVSHRRAYADNGCEWMSGTLDNTWPEDAFEPYYKPMSQKP